MCRPDVKSSERRAAALEGRPQRTARPQKKPPHLHHRPSLRPPLPAAVLFQDQREAAAVQLWLLAESAAPAGSAPLDSQRRNRPAAVIWLLPVCNVGSLCHKQRASTLHLRTLSHHMLLDEIWHAQAGAGGTHNQRLPPRCSRRRHRRQECLPTCWGRLEGPAYFSILLRCKVPAALLYSAGNFTIERRTRGCRPCSCHEGRLYA